MGSIKKLEKPHAVCIPYPAQGHINPMLNIAKLLHHKGFHITFVNTEYNHNRLIKSRGPISVAGLPSFRFETIPDGLPLTTGDVTQDIPSLCEATQRTCLVPFKKLLSELNDTSDVPPVTCVVSDAVMSFTLDAADELRIPIALFWTTSACGFWGYAHYQKLIENGYIPLKDESQLTNGYLDTTIDIIPAMEGIRLKDLPSFLRTTNPNEFIIEFVLSETRRSHKASALIFNTFYDFEKDVLNVISTTYPPIYTIGPLHSLVNQTKDDEDLNLLGSNLWKEESKCIEWLDSKEKNSVVYVNFGSITVMSPQQMMEFAWGLCNSNHIFLWIVRPDLIVGDTAVLEPAFLEKTRDRSLLASWCNQEQVLTHESIGGFLTHSGWNSTLESVTYGVPMICWPFFAEQQTNCYFTCEKWGLGMEINSNVKRDDVEGLVRELMEGEKGREMKRKAMEWKKKAEEACVGPIGSSYVNLDNLINNVLLSKGD